MFIMAFATDPQCVKPLVEGGVGIFIWMNTVCTNSGGTALGVGMNLISSLPCTSAGAVSVVSRGDVWVVGNGDVVEDVDRQVSSRTMDGD